MDVKDIIKARKKLQYDLATMLRDWELEHGMEITRVIFRGWNAMGVVSQPLGRSASCRVVVSLPKEPIMRKKYNIDDPDKWANMDDDKEGDDE